VFTLGPMAHVTLVIIKEKMLNLDVKTFHISMKQDS